MKKIIGLLMVVLLAIGIAGCSGTANTDDPMDVPDQDDPVDVDDESDVIDLSVSMTKEEIINKLGNDYETTRSFDEWTESNMTTIAYPGISFQFLHLEEEALFDSFASSIEITSSQYRYENADWIGYNSLVAIEACESVFDNVINMHAAEENQPVPDWFIYEESVSGSMDAPIYVLALQHDTDERYFDKEEIPQDTIVTAIRFLTNID